MQRLSSRSTFFYKRVFPVFWFGFIALATAVTVGTALGPQRAQAWPAMAAPGVLIIVGYVIFKRLIFDLVDEVWLEGDQLLVTNRGEQTRVPLSNVMNVNASVMTNPPRITLMLRNESSRLGKTVSFMPAGPRGLLNGFKPDPIATDLIQRIDALRQRPA
ncbi:hypothetical protein [Dyella sp. ASV21]|jgi:hypothetical protein|uniref:hypothetical protein n=1 Tax=Dyella sp. ASV21 TaxID=2795114 RepID=UPI0018EDD953|nr:hypothetical protein [Dyella sp. ASV21]